MRETDAPPAAAASPAHLPQHDVVYLEAPTRGWQGLLVGNGDLGAVVWTPPEELCLVINKCDTWDDMPEEQAAQWGRRQGLDEAMTALVSCARLTIANGRPTYEWRYSDRFAARMNLARARVRLDSRSPIAHVRADILAPACAKVLTIQYSEESPEPVEREIRLSRWGSRVLPMLFLVVETDTTTRLDGTDTGYDGDTIWVTQQLRDLRFAVACRAVGTEARASRVDSHTVRLTTPRSARLDMTVHAAVVTSEEADDPLAEAIRLVREQNPARTQADEAAHERWWAEFWEKSFVEIPDKFLENLWYVHLYQLASSCRGAYPPPMNGGIWTTNRDQRWWGYSLIWNQMQVFWGLHAANHADLVLPYFEMQHDHLPSAQRYAREVHGRGGAYYTDSANRRGAQCIDGHNTYNFTPGLFVGLDMWRHYRYTLDGEFLRGRAYPVLKEAVRFYLEFLERDEAGVYHIPGTTAYEDHLVMRDTTSDLAALRAALTALIEANEIVEADAEERKAWAEVLAHLAPYRTIPAGTSFAMDRQTLAYWSRTSWFPQASGEPLPKPILASGTARERTKTWPTMAQVEKGDPVFGAQFYPELGLVVPSAVVGIRDRGTELYELVVNTMEARPDKRTWIPVPLAWVRLGEGDRGLQELLSHLGDNPIYPQGLLVDNAAPHIHNDLYAAFHPRVVLDGKRTEMHLDLPGADCADHLMDNVGSFMATVNEMLLQSHEGLIRVFPAMPADWKDARFHLAAMGGFEVFAQREAGTTRWVVVRSNRGGTCKVAAPWGAEDVRIRLLDGGTVVSSERAGEELRFATEAGALYVLQPAGAEAVTPDLAPAPAEKRRGPRAGLGHFLGLPRAEDDYRCVRAANERWFEEAGSQ